MKNKEYLRHESLHSQCPQASRLGMCLVGQIAPLLRDLSSASKSRTGRLQLSCAFTLLTLLSQSWSSYPETPLCVVCREYLLWRPKYVEFSGPSLAAEPCCSAAMPKTRMVVSRRTLGSRTSAAFQKNLPCASRPH